MLEKFITAVVTVAIGVGAALAVYYVLNKIAELLPGNLEHRIKPYLYILPAYAAITFYLIYPAVQSIVLSFKDRLGREYVGFANYERLLTSSDFRDTLFNTLLWMIIVPAVTIIVGLAVATLADKLNPKAESASKTLIFLPMAISFVGAGTAWRFIYDYRPEGRDQVGLLNAFIGVFGAEPISWLQQDQFRINSLLLMVMLLWAQVGFSMVLLSAAIKGVPTETLEAARIDGAGERSIFFRVVVPQIRGTIITVFITTLISVMKIFDIVYVMTNGRGNTNVVGNEFFNQLYSNRDRGAAAAIVVILLIATIPIMAYQVRHFRNEEAAA